MNRRSPPERYYASAAEAAEELGLPLIGEIALDFRLPRLSEGLAGLAPDARFAERVYRFLRGEEADRVWIAGLGQAGEELPVAVGIAEAAAAAGQQPVLIVRPGEPTPEGTGGRRLEGETHAEALSLLFPAGGLAQPAGVEGVYLGWPGQLIGAQPCDPAVLLVATGDRQEDPPLPAGQIDATVLVIAWRDSPAEWIAARIAALREAGFALTGWVASAGRAAGTAGAAEAAPESQTLLAEELLGLEPAGSPATEPEPEEVLVAAGTPAQEAEPAENGAPDGGDLDTEREEVVVRAEWTRTFGPRTRGRARGGAMQPGSEPRKGITLFWWLVGAIGILVLAGVVFPEVLLPDSVRDLSKSDAPVTVTPPGASEVPAPGEAADVPVGEGEAQAAQPALEPPGSGAPAELRGPVDAETPEPIAGQSAEAPMPTASEAAEEPGSGAGEAAEALVSAEEQVTAAPVGAGEPTAIDLPAHAEPPPAAPVAEAPRDETAITELSPDARGPFAVLCGSYSRADQAAGEVRRLMAAGEAARHLAVNIPQRGIWNRVVIGRFEDPEAAGREARRLVADGLIGSAHVVSGGGSGRTVAPPVTRDSR
jgi:cell division protein FtsN